MKDQGLRRYLQNTQKFFAKMWKRFSNYNNSKKWFVLYLILLTVVLLCPLVTVSAKSYYLFSGAYLKSFVIIGISLLFLFGWNLSIRFKGFLVHLFSLREDEPLVDFVFLWVIMSVFIGIVDTIGVVEIPVRIQLSFWANIAQL
jgi:hypothetical protein